MSNKIKYGLKNVYYAKATIAGDGTATYETPVKIPGAVNLGMDANGDADPFYADNVRYYVPNGNNGYEGDLEIALVPDSFKKDIMNYIADGKGALVEDMNAEAEHFALLFQFEGDQKATRHVLYNCTATRPSVEGATREDSIEPQTESLSLAAGSVYSSALGTDVVKAEMREDIDKTTYDGWFETVYQPTAPTEP